TNTVLEPETTGGPAGGTFGPPLDVEFGRGVAELVHRLGERAITLEMTLDFDNLVQKDAVVFPGASDASLGFDCVHIDGIDVWWRLRLLLGSGQWRLSTHVRPRRVVVSRVGRGPLQAADRRVVESFGVLGMTAIAETSDGAMGLFERTTGLLGAAHPD
ncbi:MAG: hypothetical protein ACRDYF_12395, partial [Acidimicrobiia bacterium]